MLAYLLLTSTDGAPVDPDLIARFELDDLPEIPFRSDDRVVWRSRDRRVVFFGWQAFTEVAGIGSHWVVDERGLTAFTGHCWPREGGWKHGTGQSWAAQLRSYLDDAPNLQTVRDDLYGHFTVISLPASGVGFALPDWIGVDQLYVAERDGVTAISNRAGLCARVTAAAGTSPRRSLAGAGWLISEGWALDQETSYWEVDRPNAGSYVVIEPERGARLIEPDQSPLLPPAPEDPPPTYHELLDEAERDLRNTIRAIAALPVEDRVLSFSGGKDSRTLTAAIISEGVQDRFHFVTVGSPQRADAIAARAVAARFGLDWSLEDATARTPEEEMETVLLHTGLMEGMTSAWAILQRHRFSPGLTVSGAAGEGLRWMVVASSAVNARSSDDVLKALRKYRPVDALGVLRPDIRAYYQSFVTNWVREQVEHGISLVSLPSLFMHEQLLHNRIGPDTNWLPRMRINPYLTPACMRPNHRLPADRRPDPRFHLDLQRRFCLELSKMPFAESTWGAELTARLPDAEDYQGIQPVISRDPDGRTWRVKRYADYLPAIEPIVLDRNNPVHELLDYDRLVNALARGGGHPGRARLIWGVLTAAVWMGHLEEKVKIERPVAAQSVRTL